MIKLRKYLGFIGSALCQLGNELQMQVQSNQPLNIHSQTRRTMDNITYYLHNLNANLYKHRKSEYERTEEVDIESLNIAAHHLLHSKTDDVDSEKELEFTEELRKLEWLCEEIQNIPDVLRKSKVTDNVSNFDKICGNR